jgi:hypothetical protein
LLPATDICDDIVWRYTMLLADDADTVRITGALRRGGLHASNHYWSVAHLLQGRTDLPNADFASSRLLNLWVDAGTSLEDVDRAIAIICAELSETRSTAEKDENHALPRHIR